MATRPMKLAENPDLMQLLDDYLAALQAGGRPDRAALLREHPELESSLKCLEALENMVPRDVDLEELPNLDDLLQRIEPFPRSFGTYELLGEIGRGGMGVVYKARQKDLDRVVAIKMILASHLASAEHVRRFQIEARAAARLRHSNIVHIHEVGQCHGQHYFTMEYIEGESLAARIGRERLAFDAIGRIVGAVARAVEHLHQQGIVHRDLKPSNILLDRDDQPYVTDFGLAKVFEPGSEMTATGVIAGTPSYMAPEQASGRNSEVGPAADIYSLGAILYELLTGEPPFKQDSPLDTVLDILGREPTLPRHANPHVPSGLELICLKCLAKAPGDRYASAAALADDLDRFARGEALQVRPPHLGQRLLQWTRRQPALTMRLSALAVFYLVGTVKYLGGDASWEFQEKISILLVAWAAASVVCQQFLRSQRWSLPACFVWGTLDSLLLLATLLLVCDGATSGLVVGYPILIAASGLWFRVRYVSFMTALSLMSYGVVVVDFYFWRAARLQRDFDVGITRHVLFALSLVVLGATVAYLVHRLRALSSFCSRQLP